MFFNKFFIFLNRKREENENKLERDEFHHDTSFSSAEWELQN